MAALQHAPTFHRTVISAACPLPGAGGPVAGLGGADVDALAEKKKLFG